MASNSKQGLGSILVTGGCGFLGSHIVSLLKDRYPAPATTVSVLDLRTTQNRYSDVEYYSADLTSSAAVREVLEKAKPNVVIHTASPVASGRGQKAEEIMYNVNVNGTKTVIEESKKAGVKGLVYTSSASVISDNRTDLINADENWNVIPANMQKEFYTRTKADAEEMVLAANDRSGSTPFLTCAIRPSAIFGERDVQLIPPMLDVLLSGRTGFQLGENDNLFDYTYVGNVAHAHILAASRLLELSGEVANTEAEQDADGQAFFITNTTPIYFWDFTRQLWHRYYTLRTASPSATVLTPPKLLAKTITLSSGLALAIAIIGSWITWLLRLNPPKLQPQSVRFSCMTRYYSPAKARELLGYEPIWTLEQGIDRSAKWFVEKHNEQEGGRVESKKIQ